MELHLLADGELRYTSLESVDYGTGGQFYGTMEGWFHGDALSGQLRLTNLAARRPDNINLPTLRGLLTTDDNVVVYVEMDGIATLHPADDARIFVTSLRFRTGDAKYGWLNTVFGVLEGVLDTTSGLAQVRAFRCQPTITSAESTHALPAS